MTKLGKERRAKMRNIVMRMRPIEVQARDIDYPDREIVTHPTATEQDDGLAKTRTTALQRNKQTTPRK